jgi:hypothetical protein
LLAPEPLSRRAQVAHEKPAATRAGIVKNASVPDAPQYRVISLFARGRFSVPAWMWDADQTDGAERGRSEQSGSAELCNRRTQFEISLEKTCFVLALESDIDCERAMLGASGYKFGRLNFMIIQPGGDVVHNVAERRFSWPLKVYAIGSERHFSAPFLTLRREREESLSRCHASAGGINDERLTN